MRIILSICLLLFCCGCQNGGNSLEEGTIDDGNKNAGQNIDNEVMENGERQINDFFENLESEVNKLEKNVTFEDIKNFINNKLVLAYAFCFDDGELFGITFNELSENTKDRILEIVNSVDYKLEKKVPGYKEQISDDYDSLMQSAKDGLTKLNDKFKELIGKDNYDKVTDTSKNVIDKTIDVISGALDDISSSIRDWYDKNKK